MANPAHARKLFSLVRTDERAGLLTDIDGTISRIASHPDHAKVDQRVRAALARVARELTLVGAVSGRSAENARAMVGLDELVYSGNHGMEIWRNGRLEQSPLALTYAPKIRQLLDALQLPVEDDRLYVENKLLTASIHYRALDDDSELEQRLMEEVQSHAEKCGLRVTHGQKVVEIRPPIELTKGTAVLELIREYELRALIYLGDDVTDVDAFHSLLELRTRTGGHYYSIGVESNSTPITVSQGADAMVEEVEGVIELLESRSDQPT